MENNNLANDCLPLETNEYVLCKGKLFPKSSPIEAIEKIVSLFVDAYVWKLYLEKFEGVNGWTIKDIIFNGVLGLALLGITLFLIFSAIKYMVNRNIMSDNIYTLTNKRIDVYSPITGHDTNQIDDIGKVVLFPIDFNKKANIKILLKREKGPLQKDLSLDGVENAQEVFEKIKEIKPNINALNLNDKVI